MLNDRRREKKVPHTGQRKRARIVSTRRKKESDLIKPTQNLWAYKYVIDVLAEDLFHSLTEYSRAIYEEFLIPRIVQEKKLTTLIMDLEESGYTSNIFVLGDRGVGKTCFLEWLLYYSDSSKYLRDSSYYLDLKRIGEGSEPTNFILLAQIEIIKGLKTFIQKHLGDPCNEVPSTDQLTNALQIDTTYHNLHSKLARAQDNETSCLKLFVDDIDYMDVNYLGSLVRMLRPLLFLKNCRIILAARPPAYNAIIGLPDTSAGSAFGRDTPYIELDHLSVESVLRARLNIICSDEKKPLKEVSEKSSRLIRGFKPLSRVLSRLWKEKNIPKDLETIKYPFTDKQHRSIQNLSNGNVHYMLEMSKELLKYMAAHSDNLKEDDHGYHIGRDAFIEHYSSANMWENIRLQNIHRRQSYRYLSKGDIKSRGIPESKVNNSLYVCLLENLMEYHSMDASKRAAMKEFGFTEAEVEEGITELLGMEMIEELKIVDRRPLNYSGLIKGESIIREYRLTNRGEFYLEYIIHWPEYISKFGLSNHHHKARDLAAQESIKYHLLSFAKSIILIRESRGIHSQSFRVNKRNFYIMFANVTVEVRREMDKTNGKTPVLVSEKDIESYLKKLRIISTRKLSRMNSYLFYRSKIMQALSEREIPLEVEWPFIESNIGQLVDENVKTPETEAQP